MSSPSDDNPVAFEPPEMSRPASSAPAESLVAGPPAPHGDAHEVAVDPYIALRYRDCRLYLIGWVLAVIGTQVQSVAIAWELFQRTHRSMTLGWVGLVQAAPIVLLSIPAGQIADWFDRRKIVIFSQTCAAACSIGLAILSHHQGSIGWMYGLLFIGAVFQALGWPARSALLVHTVPTVHFSNAMTWASSGFQVASVAGPALGGLILIKTVSGAYVVDAMLQLAFAVCLLMLTIKPVGHASEPATIKTVLAGVRFVFDTPIILAIITLDLFAVLLGGATYLLPAFADSVLHVGTVGFGWLRSAPAIGAFAMALVIAHRPPMKRAGVSLLWAVGGFGIATIIFGLSRNYWLSLAMLALTGVFDNVSVVVRHTLVQLMTPDAMRGRVSAVNNIFVGASNELGGFESGLTATMLNPVKSVVLGGFGTLAVVIAVFMKWPQVRKFGSLQHTPAE